MVVLVRWLLTQVRMSSIKCGPLTQVTWTLNVLNNLIQTVKIVEKKRKEEKNGKMVIYVQSYYNVLSTDFIFKCISYSLNI